MLNNSLKIFFICSFVLIFTSCSKVTKSNSNYLLNIKNYDKKKYLVKKNYPVEIEGSTIAAFKPIEKNDTNYKFEFYSNRSFMKFVYKYNDALLLKLDMNNQILDSLKIEYDGWCGGIVYPERIYEFDARKWKNVDLMLGVVEETSCCDDPSRFFVIVDANNKLQVLKLVCNNEFSYEGGSIYQYENIFLPRNPNNRKIRWKRIEKESNESDSLIEYMISKESYFWNGYDLYFKSGHKFNLSK